MSTRSVIPRLRNVLVALLLVALGAGVPVRGHAHHDGDGVHVGAPDHGHGLTLVQHDMRVERPTPPTPPAVPAVVTSVEGTSPRRLVRPGREELGSDSRAPPPQELPRAPPA